MERLRESPVTLILIGINAALFLTEEVFRLLFNSSLFLILALSREGIWDGAWWQFLTHAFLHGNLFHLMVNMLALWFTGPILEELLGAWRYLLLYVSAALTGGILQTYSSTQSVDLVGASGAVCGLLTGFATLLPRLEITALIFFVIPVRMKAATLGWLVVIVSVIFWFFKIEQGIGHLAHLGGAIAGFAVCLIYRKLGLVRTLPEMPPPIPQQEKAGQGGFPTIP
ncbi:MAG: rhomboid family intramembrane serine protease [Proteobacteria bacterium]|nr:rhomboid family intramembrane serine protease [Pseudomonadota bacterium]